MVSSPARWRMILIAVVLAVVEVTGSPARAANETELIRAYFEALRARSMFVLAESAATQALSRPQLSPEVRTELLLQLSATLLAHGIEEQGAGREELWDRAQRILIDDLAADPTNPRRQTLLSRAATQLAEQGATLAWEATLFPEDAIRRDAAQKILREAIAALHQQRQKPAVSTSSTEPGLRPAEKARLQYHLATCEYWMGQVAADRNERESRYANAASTLETIGRIANDDTFNCQLLLLKAKIAHGQQNERGADSFLKAAEQLSVSPEEKDSILAEQLRLEISTDHLEAVFDKLKARLQQKGLPSDELRAVIVQALLMTADRATRQSQHERSLEYLEQAKVQQTRTGGRWRFETTARIDRYQRDREYGSELAGLIRQAESAWQTQHAAEAARLYSQASKVAAQLGQQDRAYEFGMSGAAVLVQQRQWQAAVDALTQLLKDLPDHKRAAEADLLRCYALGQLSEKSPRFVQALQEHRERYASSPTRWDALRMLAITEETQQHPGAALKSYQEIPDDYPNRNEVELRVLQILHEQLNQETTSPEDLAKWTEQARTAIARALRRLGSQPESWSLVQCRILLQIAQLQLLPELNAASEANRSLALLQRRVAVEFSDPLVAPSPEWQQLQNSMICLQIISLAQLNRMEEAQRLIEQLQVTKPTLLLTVLSGLNDLVQPGELSQRANLGQLQLKTIQGIESRRSELSPEQQTLLDLAAGQAEHAVGNWPAAIRRYDQLLAADPMNRRVLKLQADSLIRSGRPADLSRALEVWKKIEKSASPGSPEWLEARIEQASVLVSNGDKVGAKKLLGVTRALYPNMGGAKLKARAEQLSADAGK